MSVDRLAAIRQLFDRFSAREAPADVVPSDSRLQDAVLTANTRQNSQVEAASDRPKGQLGDVADSGGEPEPPLGRLMASYVGARAEEMLDQLLEGLSHKVAGELVEVMQNWRDSVLVEIAAVGDKAAAAQREGSRMGRELARTSLTLEGFQVAVSDIVARLQRLESTLDAEHQSAREREHALRAAMWSDTLGDILATIDGLEAAMGEARGIAKTLAEVQRQIDDATVRRWWRAMGEATGIKRPLPRVPFSDVDAWLSGLELTHRRLIDALERRGVTVIEAIGQPFDPYVHEAVAVTPCSSEHDGLVVREEQRGYRTADRVIRMAQVVVGKSVVLEEEVKKPRRRLVASSDTGAQGGRAEGEGIDA